MKNKFFNTTMMACLAAPVIYFIIMWLIFGIPEVSIFSKGIFYVQTAITMLIIITVPLLLWYVRPERFSNYDEIEEQTDTISKYQKAVFLRFAFFLGLVLACITLYFLLPNISFFYLAVITYLSMFFARR